MTVEAEGTALVFLPVDNGYRTVCLTFRRSIYGAFWGESRDEGLNKRKTGAAYEKAASDYLEKKSYRILEKNFRCRQSEIDLIALDGSTLVFVEVKYRSGSRTGTGAEAVDKKKQERIARCAGYYLFRHPGLRKLPCRFDVISVDGHRITHYMDAFWR